MKVSKNLLFSFDNSSDGRWYIIATKNHVFVFLCKLDGLGVLDHHGLIRLMVTAFEMIKELARFIWYNIHCCYYHLSMIGITI